MPAGAQRPERAGRPGGAPARGSGSGTPRCGAGPRAAPHLPGPAPHLGALPDFGG